MRGVEAAFCRTCLLAALAVLLLSGCGATMKTGPDSSRAVTHDPAAYDGVWLAHVVPVAGEGCPEVIDLALTSSAGRVTGWLAVRTAGSAASLRNLPVAGQLSGQGRWDVLVSDEGAESFATASGWFREEGSVGLLETSGTAGCFWRLHLRRASPARRTGARRGSGRPRARGVAGAWPGRP